MKNICFIYREKEKKEHSIEMVFDTISNEINPSKYKVHKWYKPVDFFKTIKEIITLRRIKFDIYHITGDVNYLWVLFPWNKTTMTVHDIGMYKNNKKTLKRKLFVYISFKLASFFLKKLTAVSELTKKDLINILGIPSSKIDVIPNPIVLNLKYQNKQFNTDEPVILQIGTGPHKNLESLIESVKNIKCKISIIGKPEKLLLDRMDELNINYTLSHNLTNDQVVEKYAESDILYFVSLSEGFGLPIIEAQSIGRVVLTSKEEPMCTVAGEGALLFSPNDIQGIKHGINEVLNNELLRNKLILNGLKNVERFNKKNITRMYEKFYEEFFDK